MITASLILAQQTVTSQVMQKQPPSCVQQDGVHAQTYRHHSLGEGGQSADTANLCVQ